jgi:hypothetical protein
MGYKLADLRTLSRQFVRNAMDSTMYSDSHLDTALMMAGDEWCRDVRQKTLGSITLPAASATMPSMPAAWRPEYHLNAMLLSTDGTPLIPDIAFTDYEEVLRQQVFDGSNTNSHLTTGTPRMFGFPQSATTGGILNVCCAASYNMYLWYYSPFPTWTAGGTISDSSFSFIPDEQLRIIATDGVEAKLQCNEPQNLTIAANAQLRFNNYKVSILSRNAGGRGGQVSYAPNPDEYYYQGGGRPYIPVG